MKILRLTTLMDFGGQERKYLSFTKDPELLHHQYVFAAIGYGGNAEKILRKRGFEVHILNSKFSIKNLTNIWKVYRLIKKVKPDIVHTAAGEANFHGIIAAKLAGVQSIIGEEIGIPSHSKKAQKIFRIVYKSAKKVICVSKAVKNYLIEVGEISAEKAELIYNPANAPDFERSNSHSNIFNIVYVGRLERVKNVEILLKAFAKISSENVALTIVGDGTERLKLERLADELSISTKIKFVGFSQNPYGYLADADLFVLPSLSEGFGIAAVEAMLMKVPVLCSNVGGIPEFVNDNINGWLFDPLQEAELSKKLKNTTLMNKTELQKIGMKGYEDVSDLFTEKKYVQNLENLYERISKQS